MTEIQNLKHAQGIEKQSKIRSLDIGICDLFVIWCLLFEIFTGDYVSVSSVKYNLIIFSVE